MSNAKSGIFSLSRSFNIVNVKFLSIGTINCKLPMQFYLRNRFLSSYTNTSGSLEEREMLWEHEPQASVSTAFSSSPKLSRVFV